MDRRKLWLSFLALLGAVIIGMVFLWTRPSADSQTQIRSLLLNGKRGLETKSLFQVMRCISRDYNDGSNRYPDLLRGLSYVFRENDSLEVTLAEPTIEVREQQAEVVVPVAVRGFRGQEILSYRLTLHLWLLKEGRHWKVVRATGWEPATPLAGEEWGV